VFGQGKRNFCHLSKMAGASAGAGSKSADGTITPIYSNDRSCMHAYTNWSQPRQNVLIPDESYQHKFGFTAKTCRIRSVFIPRE